MPRRWPGLRRRAGQAIDSQVVAVRAGPPRPGRAARHYTASLPLRLECWSVDIWTDVAGIYTTDPVSRRTPANVSIVSRFEASDSRLRRECSIRQRCCRPCAKTSGVCRLKVIPPLARWCWHGASSTTEIQPRYRLARWQYDIGKRCCACTGLDAQPSATS